jgi:hypothetical protein
MTETGGDRPGVEESRGTRVLLLDEDRVEGGMLAFHLRRDGCIVMLMGSPEEAIDAIDWAAPDVVVLDVSRGLGAVETLLTRLDEEGIDVLAMSERPLSGAAELLLLRLGVLDTLLKPVDPGALARRIEARPTERQRPETSEVPGEAIAGAINRHPPLQVLQLMHRHRLSARLHLEVEDDWGVVLVRHGEVIDAESPSAAGREAVVQMLRLERGAFMVFPLEPDADELGRDDVIRADLPALAAEALGRAGPRTRRPASGEPSHLEATRRPLEDAGLALVTKLANPAGSDGPMAEASRERPRLQTHPDLAELARFDNTPSEDVSDRRATIERTVESTIDEPARVGASEAKTGPRPRTAADRLMSKRLLAKTMPQEMGRKHDESSNDRAQDGFPGDAGGFGPMRDTSRTRRPSERQRFWGDPRAQALLMVLALMAGLLSWQLVVTSSAPASGSGAISGPANAPVDLETRLGKALIAVESGRRAEAIVQLESLAEDPRAPVVALTELARLVLEEGDLTRARRLLERAVLRSPGTAELQIWLGLVAFEEGDVEGARRALEGAKKMRASDAAVRGLEALVAGEKRTTP